MARKRDPQKVQAGLTGCKVGFYFTPEMVDALDQLVLDMKRMVEPQRRGAVSKSVVLQEGISMLVEDLKENGRESRLAKAFGVKP